MTTSPNGRRLIEGFEGLSLIAYLDTAGIATIGYGRIAGVKMGDTCTQAQADAWMAEDLATAEGAINKDVTVTLNQNQFDALVSFTYNVGIGAFKTSTLLKVLNHHEYQGAANAMLDWNKAGGAVSPGLQRRRLQERALFMTAVDNAS